MTQTGRDGDPGEVTRRLRRAREGDSEAFNSLFSLVLDELRSVARRQLAGERPDHTLDSMALINEAYMRLVDQAEVDWQDRAHFFGVAARAMRQVLVDHARRRHARKRGGDWRRVTIEREGHEAGAASRDVSPEELIALDEALNQLAELDDRLREVVEYRFFGGLTEKETASVLGVTTRTVQRDWARARAWLHARLYGEDG